jgi:protein-disulfide isomerase
MIKKQSPLALGIAIAALVLSIYSVYQISMAEKGDADKEFKAKVYDVIDTYVAEKSGQAPSEPIDVSLDDDPVKGKINAPVTMVEFSDFECPYCGRYFRDTYPQIVENYIDTGKVKYVFRDFPLSFHPNAAPAANAAECIREQGGDDLFFEYHDVLFANQTELSVPKLKEYASQFRIDQAKFDACVDENKYADEVQKDFAEGQSYGIKGTPGFFVNGYPISGAQPYAIFEAAIEDALNN